MLRDDGFRRFLIKLDQFLEAPQNQYLRGEDGGVGRLIEYVLREERPDLLLRMPNEVRPGNSSVGEMNKFHRWLKAVWNTNN